MESTSTSASMNADYDLTSTNGKTTAESRITATRSTGLSKTVLTLCTLMSLIQSSKSTEEKGAEVTSKGAEVASKTEEADYSDIIHSESEIMLSLCIVFLTFVTMAIILFVKCCYNKKLCCNKHGVDNSNSLLSFRDLAHREENEFPGNVGLFRDLAHHEENEFSGGSEFSYCSEFSDDEFSDDSMTSATGMLRNHLSPECESNFLHVRGYEEPAHTYDCPCDWNVPTDHHYDYVYSSGSISQSPSTGHYENISAYESARSQLVSCEENVSSSYESVQSQPLSTSSIKSFPGMKEFTI